MLVFVAVFAICLVACQSIDMTAVRRNVKRDCHDLERGRARCFCNFDPKRALSFIATSSVSRTAFVG